MKRIFTLFALIFVLFSAKATITNFQTYVDGTEVEFYWQGDTTLSPVYEVGILETTQYNYISYVGAYARAFVVANGWFGCSTNIVLENGYNYSDYEGTAAAEYFPKEDWDASVDSLSTGLTLKPGTYIVYVEGYDGAYKNVTEEMAYDIVEIEEPIASDLNETGLVEKDNAKKISINGRLLIIRDNAIYDVYGRKVK